MASIIPVAIADRKKKETKSVRASYADFVWGLPPETDALFPSLGASTIESKGPVQVIQIIDVEKESPAAIAGLKAGDQVVSLDGVAIPDKQALNTAMAAKRWGDSVAIVVKRSAENVSATVMLRRRTNDGRP